MSKDDKNTPQLRDIEPLLLQAYYDGELEAAEAASLEARLEADDGAQQRLGALREMSELVRFELEQRVEDVDFSNFWARLEPRLDETPQSDHFEKIASAPVGWFTRLRESVSGFFQNQRGLLVPALAAAVVALLIVIPILMNNPAQTTIEEHQTVVIVEPPQYEGDALGAVSYTPNKTPVIWYLGGGEAPSDGLSPENGTDAEGESDYPEWLPDLLHRLYQMGLRAPHARPGMPELSPPPNEGGTADDPI